MAAADRLLTSAAEHYNAGRATEAGALCGDVLNARPDHIPALHLAAVIAFSEGRAPEGSALLGRLFARDPNHVPAWITLGDALAVKGEHEGAVSAFQRAVALRPKDADLRAKLGTALFELARYEEAEASYRHALSLDPDLSRARFNLGVTLATQGRFTEAEQVYRDLLMRDPDYPGAWRRLGNALAGQDNLDEAVIAYVNAQGSEPNVFELHIDFGNALHKRREFNDAAVQYRHACELAPDDIVPLRLLGHALYDSGRAKEAADVFRRASMLDPTDVGTLSNLGACLSGCGQFEAAMEACEQALAINPDFAPAHINLGIVHERTDNVEAAVAAHRRAISADPNHAMGYANLAIALRNRGDLEEMLEVSHQAVRLAPEHGLTRFNHANFLLMCGDLVNGFADYQWGYKYGISEAIPRVAGQEWQGEDFAGKTLLIFAEYGIGDALQFVRYLPMVVARGGSVLLQVQPAIAALLRPMPDVTVLGRHEPVRHYDLQLPLMDLPRIFGTALDTIPADIPYLNADPAKVGAWRQALGQHGPLKVGVVWAGSPLHKGDKQRSLSAEAVLPRLVMPGVQLFSLQKEPRPADGPVLAELGADVTDLAPLLEDFTDTAAAVCALDLVISVDTSVAHLAGALGRPCWILLPYAVDWRWLRDREDSPWYPSIRLFRQSRQRAWDGVLARVAAELSRAAAGERALLLPSSRGQASMSRTSGTTLRP